jgi:DNA-binding NtrC family response regulator
VMTEARPSKTAITGMKLGAYDYLSKPYRMAEVDVVVRRACEKLRTRSRKTGRCNARLSRIDDTPGSRHAIRRRCTRCYRSSVRVAATASPVLITGRVGNRQASARARHPSAVRTAPARW